ncbi:MAG TPA: class I SAM-dependent methyltransferase [Actinophytocola sp.]|uniref:class I SAM-dependent methyltransferase n=1 Tax=Actinophytocola sp. TaxID=1872138 RepID=UPI002DB8F464|nr:class I SAM-dependent methyltransferase [Actinophytocola sp.]HEU5474155.1 class I SAM-dependent methyltransferase [Actinophytocola sp.]
MPIAEELQHVIGLNSDIGLSAYDGSRSGRPDAPVRVELRSPLALSYLASAPGELGLARAYISGALEVHGDMYTMLSGFADLDFNLARMPRELLARMVAARLWWPVRRPPQEARLQGRRHSPARDASAISHHYDVSNRFYEWVLGPSMAYTCAVYRSERDTLEDAQYEKFDLVARKLGLRPGMRLLDVGCGWGGMVIHAAKHYGVQALGVTLSRNQAQWAQKAIAEAGLGDVAEVRHGDYREIAESGFDAISSIGLTEHIGAKNLPGYFQSLHDKLRPGARLLNHCITRPDNWVGSRTGEFINRYVFPDGELESPGQIVSAMHDNGFEVRHEENLREHYALTLTAWCANLDANWTAAVEEVGPGRARVWRLYMAGSRLGFDRNTVQLHQVLGVRLDGTRSHMPLRPEW